MTAPCLVRLDSEIASAPSEVAKARLLAEKGCYLARVGYFEEAESIRMQLRASFGAGEDLEVAIRIMMLEGLQDYFSLLGGRAGDRIMRAQFLSRAANNSRLVALSSAWLAHIQFNEGKIAECVESLRLSMDRVSACEKDAVVRIGLVAGDLHMTYASPVCARRWYAISHKAAIDYGDQAAIGAWTYNSAAIKAFRLRVQQALGLDSSGLELQLVDGESRSATNFQMVASVKALDHLLDATRASVFILREQFKEAAELLLALTQGDIVPSGYGYRMTLEADLILALVKMQQFDLATQVVEKVDFGRLERAEVDDRILVLDSLNKAYAAAPHVLLGHYEPQSLEPLRDRYIKIVASIRERLDPISARIVELEK